MTKKQQSSALAEGMEKEIFSAKNSKRALYIMGAVVVLIIAIFGYKTYRSSQEEKAQNAIFLGQQYFAAQDFDKALNGDGKDFMGFIKIADQFSGTKTANLANLYAGLCYAQNGEFEKAINYLKDFDQCDDAIISPAAMAALGNCYASTGAYDKATSLLLDAAKKADNKSLSPIFLLQAGEIFEKQGNKDEALKCYQEIKDKYANTYSGQNIDMYIGRLNK